MTFANAVVESVIDFALVGSPDCHHHQLSIAQNVLARDSHRLAGGTVTPERQAVAVTAKEDVTDALANHLSHSRRRSPPHNPSAEEYPPCCAVAHVMPTLTLSRPIHMATMDTNGHPWISSKAKLASEVSNIATATHPAATTASTGPRALADVCIARVSARKLDSHE